MSDIVELYDESGSNFYYCDMIGFKEVPFTPNVPREQASSYNKILNYRLLNSDYPVTVHVSSYSNSHNLAMCL